MNYFGSRPLKKLVQQFKLDAELGPNLAFGWGRKASFYKAQAYAQNKNIKCISLEDGFIRSLGLGKCGYAPLSLVVDQTGIYFDGTQSSDLENLILMPEEDLLNQRAAKAIESIVEYKITKYNSKFDSVDQSNISQYGSTENVLLIDQTFGDQSVRFCGATVETFKHMLDQAHHHHPNAIIWIKTHPDVLAGKAQGHYSNKDFELPYVKVITDHVNPFALLQHFKDVYVVSSQMGFEALMLGKKVHCFGLPWYAGWGITDDTHAPIKIAASRRTVNRSLLHLFACAYLIYARYISPITQQRCELEDTLKLLLPNMNFQQQLPSQLVAYRFSPWKKRFIQDYLAFPNTKLTFKKYFKPSKNDYILAWGKTAYQLKKQGYSKIITVEDGFIRSVGLGANLIRPCSLVFDNIGIYYDATCPSRIENLLNKVGVLNEQQIQRIDHILLNIKRLEISKYNIGHNESLKRPVDNKKIILVVGQVEDDMSIQLGGVDIKTNLELLKQVRLDHPDAYIIFKPHPDVEAGLRMGKIKHQLIYEYADQIENSVSIQRLFEIVDELHTISSLSGFEALIRGLKVYCYGIPFYAGWGLTQDKYQCKRRKNKLNLQQLLYVTLVEYPTYNLADTAHMDIASVNPEDVIDYIDVQRSKTKHPSTELNHYVAWCLKKLRFWKK